MPNVHTADHLVILVHGINTRALWMDRIAPVLERAGLAVGSTSYGRYSVLRFLSPWKRGRDAAIRRVLTDIRTAREVHKRNTGHYPKKLSVISHSFGTYVIARILLQAEDLKWDRVIFSGSVIRDDFPLGDAHRRFNPPLLNEIGSRDFWPVFAESAGWGYGSVGSTGFNRSPVVTRWHRGLDHSAFLNESFCQTFWVPFLLGDNNIDRGTVSELPLWARLLAALPLRWIILMLPPIAIALCVWFSIAHVQ